MKNKILFVVSFCFGLLLIGAGLNKLFYFVPPPEHLLVSVKKILDAFLVIGWLLSLVSIVEIIGGILVIIPKTRALGAIVVFPIIAGILLTHIFNLPVGMPIALLLLAINLWVIWEYREKYLPMINVNQCPLRK